MDLLGNSDLATRRRADRSTLRSLPQARISQIENGEAVRLGELGAAGGEVYSLPWGSGGGAFSTGRVCQMLNATDAAPCTSPAAMSSISCE